MSRASELAFSRTRQLVQQGIVEQLHLGAQVAVIQRGQIVADFAIGEAKPGHPLRPDHILPWLSSSKPIAALAVAQLIEQGRLRLGDRVSAHLPEFAAGGKAAITVRHLLTHTAGFRAADRLPQTLSPDEMLARINATPLDPGWVPGETAGYQHFSSWFILGELLRWLTRRPFDRLARERILSPLGIEEAWIGMTRDELEAHRPRLTFLWDTTHHGTRVFEASDADVLTCRPGSGGRGPARELARFYAALLDILGDTGTRADAPIGRATLQAFITRQRAGMFDHTFHRVMDWGLGFIPNPYAGDGPAAPYGYGPHASALAFGHSGSQSSCAFADPAHGLAVAWICNGRPGEIRHQRRAWALNAAIYEDLGRAHERGVHHR